LGRTKIIPFSAYPEDEQLLAKVVEHEKLKAINPSKVGVSDTLRELVRIAAIAADKNINLVGILTLVQRKDTTV
jgi:hypothetical protein